MVIDKIAIQFISAALSPAKVLNVEILDGENRSCRVVASRMESRLS